MAGVQGRGSAVAVILVLFLIFAPSDAKVYTVGGLGGWSFNADQWNRPKFFRPGDQIIFNYSPFAHNVVVVNAAGYRTCRPNAGARFLTSGKDRVTLRKGTNYFICSFAGHCDGGRMKLALVAK